MSVVREKINFIQSLTQREIDYIDLYCYDIPDIDIIIGMVVQFRREVRLKKLLD